MGKFVMASDLDLMEDAYLQFSSKVLLHFCYLFACKKCKWSCL